MNKFILQYGSTLLFSAILTVCVALSMWLSQFIPDNYFDKVITPILIAFAVMVEFGGAMMLFRHSEGLRVRRAFAWALIVWGIADGLYIFSWMTSSTPMMNMGAYSISSFELMLGNLLGWVLLLYPAEILRPGWLNGKRILLQILPMCALVALDYVSPVNLQPVIALYPFVLILFFVGHVRGYRTYCEENFSSMEDIDVQWIIRYLVMVILVGVVYMFICLSHFHARGFTQQWLVLVMFIYSIDQILFRHDPRALMRKVEKAKGLVAEEEPVAAPETANAAYRKTLEEWMEREKPYRDPDFKLLDLGQVLPMNRTYLSQFIHTEYDCTFYQFVNNYRVREAMNLKQENPALKAQEISACCGFSSPAVFSRTFAAVTGLTPSEWARRNREN